MQALRSAAPDDDRALRAAPALTIAAAALLTVLTVWGIERAGYAPCELCLRERLPFYGGLPLALLVGGIALKGRPGLLPAGYAALGLLFAAGAALGVYHAGVEWKLWPGPSSCTGAFAPPPAVGDFLQQLQTVQVVRCDAPALKVAGLSLAAWNVLVCLVLAGVAAFGFVRSDPPAA